MRILYNILALRHLRDVLLSDFHRLSESNSWNYVISIWKEGIVETYRLLECNIWNLRCGVVLGKKVYLLATCRNWKGYVNTSKVNEKWNRWKP